MPTMLYQISLTGTIVSLRECFDYMGQPSIKFELGEYTTDDNSIETNKPSYVEAYLHRSDPLAKIFKIDAVVKLEGFYRILEVYVPKHKGPVKMLSIFAETMNFN